MVWNQTWTSLDDLDFSSAAHAFTNMWTRGRPPLGRRGTALERGFSFSAFLPSAPSGEGTGRKQLFPSLFRRCVCPSARPVWAADWVSGQDGLPRNQRVLAEKPVSSVQIHPSTRITYVCSQRADFWMCCSHHADTEAQAVSQCWCVKTYLSILSSLYVYFFGYENMKSIEVPADL